MSFTCLKAIETKYLGPSTYRGSRIKASAEGGNSLTIGYDHALDSAAAHAKAAEALAVKMDWHGVYFAGATRNGYVFVNCGSTCKDEAFTIARK